ncbi:hypothetical protein STXM2123_1500 [Streptomyces sp. F-3]|nr:hypothetical protein STXM2123_1500 [Streptomyces sp. F-3]
MSRPPRCVRRLPVMSSGRLGRVRTVRHRTTWSVKNVISEEPDR